MRSEATEFLIQQIVLIYLVVYWPDINAEADYMLLFFFVVNSFFRYRQTIFNKPLSVFNIPLFSDFVSRLPVS